MTSVFNGFGYKDRRLRFVASGLGIHEAVEMWLYQSEDDFRSGKVALPKKPWQRLPVF